MFSLSIQMCTSYVYIPTCCFACLTLPTPIRQWPGDSNRWDLGVSGWEASVRSLSFLIIMGDTWRMNNKWHHFNFDGLIVWGFEDTFAICSHQIGGWSNPTISSVFIDIKLVKYCWRCHDEVKCRPCLKLVLTVLGNWTKNPNMKGGCSTPRIRVYLPRELRAFIYRGYIMAKYIEKQTWGLGQCNCIFGDGFPSFYVVTFGFHFGFGDNQELSWCLSIWNGVVAQGRYHSLYSCSIPISYETQH